MTKSIAASITLASFMVAAPVFAEPNMDKYNRACAACHVSGVAGAPKSHDVAAWESRMAKGMDAVMENVINGVNAMPARGICMTCSDEELRAVVDYMLAQ